MVPKRHLKMPVAARVVACGLSAAVEPPVPFGPVPCARQLHWQEMELIGFVHFSVNTFTDREWGNGDEAENVFHPTAFDANQIVRVAKVPDCAYENPDGSPLRVSTDYFGQKRSAKNPFPGPFEKTADGKQQIKVWPFNANRSSYWN
jgi:hypothetical protein